MIDELWLNGLPYLGNFASLSLFFRLEPAELAALQAAGDLLALERAKQKGFV